MTYFYRYKKKNYDPVLYILLDNIELQFKS